MKFFLIRRKNGGTSSFGQGRESQLQILPRSLLQNEIIPGVLPGIQEKTQILRQGFRPSQQAGELPDDHLCAQDDHQAQHHADHLVDQVD